VLDDCVDVAVDDASHSQACRRKTRGVGRLGDLDAFRHAAALGSPGAVRCSSQESFGLLPTPDAARQSLPADCQIGAGASDLVRITQLLMKFVHAADLHLDSPMKGLAAYPGAPVEAMRGATRHAFESLVEMCIDEQVQLLVIAGDVYDGDWKDVSTGLYLRSQPARLREAEIEVVLIRGNHDAASVISRKLKLPGIHVLPHDRPASVVLEDVGAVVHGQSYATRAVTENLAAGYPAPLPGLVNVGLLHTCLGGDYDHDRYAPCSLEDLVARG
jgi:Calcineurin-like phosphoesterase